MEGDRKGGVRMGGEGKGGDRKGGDGREGDGRRVVESKKILKIDPANNLAVYVVSLLVYEYIGQYSVWHMNRVMTVIKLVIKLIFTAILSPECRTSEIVVS